MKVSGHRRHHQVDACALPYDFAQWDYTVVGRYTLMDSDLA